MKKEKSKGKVVVLNKGVNTKQSTLWSYVSAETEEVSKPTKYHIVKDMPFRVRIVD